VVVAGKLSVEVGVVGVVEKLSVEVVAGGVVVAGVEKVDVVAGVEVGALKADGAGAGVGILKVVGAGAGVVNILREAAGVVGCSGAVICAGAGGV
jgi:hypothetical protein